jgi:hypothetical protein
MFDYFIFIITFYNFYLLILPLSNFSQFNQQYSLLMSWIKNINQDRGVWIGNWWWSQCSIRIYIYVQVSRWATTHVNCVAREFRGWRWREIEDTPNTTDLGMVFTLVGAAQELLNVQWNKIIPRRDPNTSAVFFRQSFLTLQFHCWKSFRSDFVYDGSTQTSDIIEYYNSAD